MSSREVPPPPVIGKAGNLTVFITPSPKKNPNPNLTSSPDPSPKLNLSPASKSCLNLSPSSKLGTNSRETKGEKTILPLNLSPSPSPKLGTNSRESKGEKTISPSPVKEKHDSFVVAPPPTPVQVPPKQFEYDEGKKVNSHGSPFGFFWDAVSRVQQAHSSLDEYLANWFGLDQSKYQWALNDYYETNTKEMEATKISKGQAV